ncbi:MAG: sugar transferase [Bacteroidota bacterium]|nr:sugar transferase [Bacteroidota bacterium]
MSEHEKRGCMRVDTGNEGGQSRSPRHFPRVLDIVFSAMGLLVLSPLLGLIAILVRASSPGPVFHRAVRAGVKGRTFTLYKFRTMYHRREDSGPGVTYGDDPRITAVGRVLRRWKLDELPQLVNVLKGEMSLVGPRPEDPRFIPYYPSHLRSILEYKPGITSPASVRYRNESAILPTGNPEAEYIANILPEKLAIDIAYFRTAGLLDHVQLLFKTVLGRR